MDWIFGGAGGGASDSGDEVAVPSLVASTALQKVPDQAPDGNAKAAEELALAALRTLPRIPLAAKLHQVPRTAPSLPSGSPGDAGSVVAIGNARFDAFANGGVAKGDVSGDGVRSDDGMQVARSERGRSRSPSPSSSCITAYSAKLSWSDVPSCAVAAAEAYGASLAADNEPRRSAGVGAAKSKPSEVLRARVQVCVSGFSLGTKVDVEAIARKLPNTQIRERKSGSRRRDLNVTVQSLRQPFWIALVRKTGRVQLYTKFDGDESRLVAKRVARLLRKRYSSAVGFHRFHHERVHVVGKLGFRVIIEDFVKAYGHHAFSAQTAAGTAGALGDASEPPTRQPVCVVLNYEANGRFPFANVEVNGEQGVVVKVYESGLLKVPKAKSAEKAKACMRALVPHLVKFHAWW